MNNYSEERAERVMELGKTLLAVSIALESEDWAELDRLALSAARQSRTLLLSDRAEAKEEKWRTGK